MASTTTMTTTATATPTTTTDLPSNCRLVDVGTHSVALYTHGPAPASDAEPVVVFVSGVASDALNWQAVVRLLGASSAASVRSYTYDRAGYHRSGESPYAPSAENVAVELALLLERAPIRNPLVLVGHSWAGVLLPEFIARQGLGQVAGLVLVDANHETAPLVMDVDDPDLWAVAGGVDPYEAWGLAAEHQLLPAEWAAFRAAEGTAKHRRVERREEGEQYLPSFATLRRKHLLEGDRPLAGDKPVYVIGGMRSRDWSGLYRAGVAQGNGTAEQRRRVEALIAGVDAKNAALMQELRKFSTRSELVFATESGHFVQMTQPEIVIDGIHWVLRNVSASS